MSESRWDSLFVTMLSGVLLLHVWLAHERNKLHDSRLTAIEARLDSLTTETPR